MPYQLRRTIRSNQVRIGRLQFRIPAHQRIIFRIGNLGRIFGMVQPVMPRDLAGKPHHFIRGIGFIHVDRHR